MGRAIALGLAQAGAAVAVAARNLDTLEPVAAEIRALGATALALALDVSQPDQIPSAVQRVEAELGAIDVLFNVAGTNVRRPITEIAEAEFDQVMDVNIKGAYFLSREVGKGMIARQQGKVINIASVTSAIGLAKVTAYACSKGALAQLTRGLAVEWGPHNIQVNAIAPGFILTEWPAGPGRFREMAASPRASEQRHPGGFFLFHCRDTTGARWCYRCPFLLP